MCSTVPIYFLSELIFKSIKCFICFDFIITKSLIYILIFNKKYYTMVRLNVQKISSYLDYYNSLKSFSLD